MPTEKGEIGVFPALLKPAREQARELGVNEVVELEEWPGFWISRSENLPSGALVVTSFAIEAINFSLFEY